MLACVERLIRFACTKRVNLWLLFPPEPLTDAEGRVCWEAQNSAWGQQLNERSVQLSGHAPNLRMQGQYLEFVRNKFECM
nr:RHS domain-containing protein [Pseudescherichia vulneris]